MFITSPYLGEVALCVLWGPEAHSLLATRGRCFRGLSVWAACTFLLWRSWLLSACWNAGLAPGLADCKVWLCALAAGVLQGQGKPLAQLVFNPRGMWLLGANLLASRAPAQLAESPSVTWPLVSGIGPQPDWLAQWHATATGVLVSGVSPGMAGYEAWWCASAASMLVDGTSPQH